MIINDRHFSNKKKYTYDCKSFIFCFTFLQPLYHLIYSRTGRLTLALRCTLQVKSFDSSYGFNIFSFILVTTDGAVSHQRHHICVWTHMESCSRQFKSKIINILYFYIIYFYIYIFAIFLSSSTHLSKNLFSIIENVFLCCIIIYICTYI